MNEQDPATLAEAAERGRYAVYQTDDGGVLISRAGPLCDRCRECGCGEQLPQVGPISGVLIKLAQAAQNGEITVAGAMKKLVSRDR